MSWLFNVPPQSSVCLFHIIKHNISVRLSLSKAASSKCILLPGLPQLLRVHESQARKCSSWADRSTGWSLFSLCRAQVGSGTQKKPLDAGVPIARLEQICGVECWEEKDCWGHQQYTAVTDSTSRITPRTTKPPTFPERSLYPGTGELVFLVWGRNLF